MLAPTAVSQASTGTYFVAVSGDDAGSGSFSAPWQTIQYAVEQLDPGDTLYIRGGTYHEVVRINAQGTQDAPITIRTYPGESVIIDGKFRLPEGDYLPQSVSDTPYGRTTGFIFTPLLRIAGEYIELHGPLEVARSRGSGLVIFQGITDRAHHITLEDIVVHDTKWQALRVARADDVILRNIEVYHSALFAPFDRPGAVMNWPGAFKLSNVTRAFVEGCQIYANWGEGFDSTKSSDFVLENCTIYDNWAINVYVNRVERAEYRNNLIYCTNRDYLRGGDPPAGIAFNNEDSTVDYAPVSDILIMNNVVVGCGNNLSFWGAQDNNDPISRVRIYNNTFVRSVSNVARPKALIVREDILQDVEIKNNIFYQLDGDLVAGSGDARRSVDFAANLWWDGKGTLPPPHAQSSSDVIADPDLLNPEVELVRGTLTRTPFRLTAMSPAIDAGVALTVVTTDMDGKPRTPRPDIGAHEFGARFRLNIPQ